MNEELKSLEESYLTENSVLLKNVACVFHKVKR